MKKKFYAVVALVLLVAALAAAQGAKKQIQLKVLDTAGKPVSGATASTTWDFSGPKPSQFEWVTTGTTDDSGTVHLAVPDRGPYATFFCVFNADHSLAGSVMVPPTEGADTVTLQPTAHIKVSLKGEGGFQFTKASWNLMVTTKDFGSLAGFASAEGKDLAVPAGQYTFSLFSLESPGWSRQITLKAGRDVRSWNRRSACSSLRKELRKACAASQIFVSPRCAGWGNSRFIQRQVGAARLLGVLVSPLCRKGSS